MVGDTIPHVRELSVVRDQAAVALYQCSAKNDRISRKRRTQRSDIRIGELALLRNRHPGNKFRLSFEIEPWKVSEVKGTMVTARNDNETITRNILLLKLFRQPDTEPEKVKDVQPTDQVDPDDDSVGDPQSKAGKSVSCSPGELAEHHPIYKKQV
ncbi:hypothetical protein NDU88_008027 [Pleurodeles waltl]|uniref:Uncharacterized protein n=1 Tax=Pleurodeles waltl TaxID=8319 RepID=A0AAV7RRZ8_PLEWA|nr:hypothetical protein NDU88_008027 [Pleurodeles waltl]